MSEYSKYMDGETPVGEQLFKLAMKKFIVETRAASSHLQENLTNLDTYMSTANPKNEKSNHYVKVNVNRLNARG